MSSTASDAGPPAPTPYGRLLKLPGELRNEVYGWLLRGVSIISVKPTFSLTCRCRPFSDDLWAIKEYPGGLIPYSDLSILSVSKAIRDEVLPALYSKSFFRFYVQFDVDDMFRLWELEAVDRMMNIELGVVVRPPILNAAQLFPADSNMECMNRYKQTWKATLGCIIRTRNIRKNLHIKWCICARSMRGELLIWPKIDRAIPEWMYRTLKRLVRFRTLTLQIFIPRGETYIHNLEESSKMLRSKMEAIEYCLVDTLGPCVIDNAYDRHHDSFVGTLTFHPQQHIPTILRGRAEALRAKADGLEVEAELAERGM